MSDPWNEARERAARQTVREVHEDDAALSEVREAADHLAELVDTPPPILRLNAGLMRPLSRLGTALRSLRLCLLVALAQCRRLDAGTREIRRELIEVRAELDALRRGQD